MRKETPSTAVRSPYRRTRSSTTRTSSGDASAEGRRRSGARFVVTGHRHHRWGASSWHGRPLGREDLLLISGDIGRRLVGTPQPPVRPQRLASVVGPFAGGARAPRMSGVSGSGILDPGEPTTPMTHREVERKVRVPEDFALPPLGGIAPGVTDIVAGEPFTMVAAYHDTHDLRLIRWGATLRRREGGPDEGWHLKLPVADEESLVRDEIALPLDAGDVGHVPSAIADLVRALVREAPMVHVVTVRTRRAPYALLDGTGVPVAELVDDRVEVVEDGVVVRSFREIEVEARSGPSRSTTTVLDTVAAALVASGGTPGIRSKATEAIGPRGSGAPDVSVPPWPRAKDPASETIRCVLATNVQAFLLADVRVRRNLTDSVHQMRVAARTLRSALRTFAPLVGDEWSTTLRAELRSAAEALATLRDTEVHLARLETHAGLLPLEDREHAVRVIDVWLRERLEAARAVADAELRSERHLRLLTDLVEAARDPRFTSAARAPVGRGPGGGDGPARGPARLLRRAADAARARGPSRDRRPHGVRARSAARRRGRPRARGQGWLRPALAAGAQDSGRPPPALIGIERLPHPAVSIHSARPNSIGETREDHRGVQRQGRGREDLRRRQPRVERLPEAPDAAVGPRPAGRGDVPAASQAEGQGRCARPRQRKGGPGRRRAQHNGQAARCHPGARLLPRPGSRARRHQEPGAAAGEDARLAGQALRRGDPRLPARDVPALGQHPHGRRRRRRAAGAITARDAVS